MLTKPSSMHVDVSRAASGAESPFPLNFQLAMVHLTLVAGACEQTINASVGVEATQLYPDMKFVTVEEYLDGLL